jgi:hypothetical protein
MKTVGQQLTAPERNAEDVYAASKNELYINSVTGGGNITNGLAGTAEAEKYDAINSYTAKMVRMNLYPNYYYNDSTGQTKASTSDKAMLQAYNTGITPIVLFEYYGNYTNPLGDYKKWYKIGHDFAERFGPGGTWAQENSISDWGVTVFQAINEPDAGTWAKCRISTSAYATALEGLADGVHSVDSALKVIPGAYASANSNDDWTLRGYGPAIAPLLNNSKLDGIDLHTYYDVDYAPMEKSYDDSAQKTFDNIKSSCEITADINFYATEFNYKWRNCTEEQVAAGFLTGLWDNLGVVKNDGSTGATQLVFPWSLFNSQSKDIYYGMCTQMSPYTLTKVGQTYKLALELTDGMRMYYRSPKTKGEYELTGNGKKMWVWQNRKYWSDHYGTTFTVNNIPTWAHKLVMYSYDGLKETIVLSGQASQVFSNLTESQTYMFVASVD